MVYAHDNVVVFVRVYNQQRVLVAINRGEACEVVLDDSPLLNVSAWQLKEGKGSVQEGSSPCRRFLLPSGLADGVITKGPHKRAFFVNRADYRLDTFSDRYFATPSGDADIPSLPFSH